MIKIITIVSFLMSVSAPSDVEIDRYDHRMEPSSFDRIESIYEPVRQASDETDVPIDLIVGVIYNESNAHSHVIGDNGRSYGLGQIRCAIWKDWLRNRTNLRTCRDLLDPRDNAKAIGEILTYLKDQSGTWSNALEAYHTGTYRDGERFDEAYKRRVRFFGRLFSTHYRVHHSWQRQVDTIESSVNQIVRWDRQQCLKRL